MSRKLSQYFVAAQFKRHGCTLLDEYTDSKTPLRYRCVCGQICKKRYSKLQQGQYRCWDCSVRERARQTRLDESLVKKEFEKYGCVLLESYTGYNTQMKYRCKCGNISTKKFDHLKRGQWRCEKCAIEQRRHTIDFVREIFEKRGCRLLSAEYHRSDQKLDYLCPQGSVASICFASFQRGRNACKCCTKRGPSHWMWIHDRQEVKKRKTFRERHRSMIRSCLKCFGRNKNKRYREIVGYTPTELREHIEVHPNYYLVKNKQWEIDHIFPIMAFYLYGIHDPKVVCCLENLAPKLRTVNAAKNDSFLPAEFEEWLRSKCVKFDSKISLCILHGLDPNKPISARKLAAITAQSCVS
jgi:hypothetical protein